MQSSRVSDYGFKNSTTESLILAQNERWRRGLGMQVERRTFGLRSGERVSNAWEICSRAGDNSSNGLLIPHDAMGHMISWLKEASVSSFHSRMIPRSISLLVG